MVVGTAPRTPEDFEIYYQKMRSRDSQKTPNTDKPSSVEKQQQKGKSNKRPLASDEVGINYPLIGHWAYSNLTLILLIGNIVIGLGLSYYWFKNASNMADEIESKKWHAAGITKDVELSLNQQRLKIEDTYETKTTEILQKISAENNFFRNLLNQRFDAYEKELDYQTTKIANLERKLLDVNRDLKISRVVMPCDRFVEDAKGN